ncbi:MAG: hypothetical protein HON94_04285 [Methylococcales bacterium]|nr:hypothetical protein [Methylococcales bacterium]MBT7408447.1 hypothetical protein [Methylococcales bacterium]
MVNHHKIIISLFLLICLKPLSAAVLENATNGNIRGWSLYDDIPKGAKINNIYDKKKKSRVIKLEGEAKKNGYKFSLRNKKQFGIRWSMYFTGSIKAYVGVKTTQGYRYISYTLGDSNNFKKEKYIYFGVGQQLKPSRWQVFERNLIDDLKKAQPGNQILAVNAFLLRGDALIDDIELFKISKVKAKVELSSSSAQTKLIPLQNNKKKSSFKKQVVQKELSKAKKIKYKKIVAIKKQQKNISSKPLINQKPAKKSQVKKLLPLPKKTVISKSLKSTPKQVKPEVKKQPIKNPEPQVAQIKKIKFIASKKPVIKEKLSSNKKEVLVKTEKTVNESPVPKQQKAVLPVKKIVAKAKPLISTAKTTPEILPKITVKKSLPVKPMIKKQVDIKIQPVETKEIIVKKPEMLIVKKQVQAKQITQKPIHPFKLIEVKTPAVKQNFKKVIENAEDGLIHRWSVSDEIPLGAEILNIKELNNNRAIKLNGKGRSNEFKLLIGQAKHNKISWKIKSNKDFTVFIDVETGHGLRTLTYYSMDRTMLGLGRFIKYGLGDKVKNGQWHTITRDIQADLDQTQTKMKLIKIIHLKIRGSGLVDDVMLIKG